METIRANFLTQVSMSQLREILVDLLLKKPPKLFRDGKVEAVFLPETVKCKVLACPHSKAAKLYPELHQQKQIEQVKRKDLYLVWYFNNTTCTVFTPQYNNDTDIPESIHLSTEDHQDHEGTEAQRLNLGLSNLEKSKGEFIAAYDYLMQACNEDGSRYFSEG